MAFVAIRRFESRGYVRIMVPPTGLARYARAPYI